jgi:recombination protein RecA
MARPKKNQEEKEITSNISDIDDFTNDIMAEVNRSEGDKVMFSMDGDDAPANVKRWISTGSRQLDFRIANKRGGGVPEGRITEIYGPPSIGKSHIGLQLIKSVQKMGGMAFYFDTEFATSLEYFAEMGVSPKNFKLIPLKVVEEIFAMIEKIIIMARTNEKTKEIPILIVWDSIAASIPRSELEPSEKVQPGRLAAAMSIGLKRIVEVIGSNNVTLVLMNQTRTKIGVMFGDPEESAGGNAIKFYSSVRIKLTGGGKVVDNKENIIGSKVYATLEKNKVAPPRRRCEFEIHFGVGIAEHDHIFDMLRSACKAGPIITEKHRFTFDGAAWKDIKVYDAQTGEEILQKRLRSSELPAFFEENKDFLEEAMEKVYVYKGVKNPMDEVE